MGGKFHPPSRQEMTISPAKRSGRRYNNREAGRGAAHDVRPEDDALFDPQEAAEYLRISRGALYQMVARRQVGVSRMGRLLRFRRSQLDSVLKIEAAEAYGPGPSGEDWNG